MRRISASPFGSGGSEKVISPTEVRAALAGEASLDEAAQRAKSAAWFKDCMRTLGARPMDHFDLHWALWPNASSRKADGHRR